MKKAIISLTLIIALLATVAGCSCANNPTGGSGAESSTTAKEHSEVSSAEYVYTGKILKKGEYKVIPATTGEEMQPEKVEIDGRSYYVLTHLFREDGSIVLRDDITIDYILGIEIDEPYGPTPFNNALYETKVFKNGKELKTGLLDESMVFYITDRRVGVAKKYTIVIEKII